ncbi:MAG: hypothetical protein ABIC04_00835 [Nanoarchaeota archaeon]
MIFKTKFNFNWKQASLLIFLLIFPNILSIYHTTIFGVRVHLFQYLIFLAALIYGPYAGAISGALGSIYSAIALHNPYIIIGNILLGFFFGYFVKLKWNILFAVITAYFIQLPWLWLTDVYLIHMPVSAVAGIIVALFVSDVILSVLAKYTFKHIQNFFR